MTITPVTVKSILTRTGGYLAEVASHSLQPYRGCALGRSLCGAGCYVQHNRWITNGRAWGTFVEPRTNAAEAYTSEYPKEYIWAKKHFGRMAVFLSSSTEPFQPAERQFGVTRSVLTAMLDQPPDELIIQTHSHHVTDAIDVLSDLSKICRLRVHISIETDRPNLPGLANHASPAEQRIGAGRQLRDRAIYTVVTVAPLLPIDHPDDFFRTLSTAFDAAVIDHFVGGDGTPDGRRTTRTPLPLAMATIEPASVNPDYLNKIVHIAKQHFTQVGVGQSGFAGKYDA